MNITSQCKLFDVIETYPFLEEQVMNIAPQFKNLKNPVLRRTVGKLATLAQVAQVAGMDVSRLVNTLRKAAGQEELVELPSANLDVNIPRAVDDPEWITGEPQFTINGTELLQRGEVPLGKVNELLGQLTPGRFILLVTNFEPTPILDAMMKQNRRVFHKITSGDEQQHFTFLG